MTTITVSELATELNTDARTTRKFLRSITEVEAQPGKGSRWSIEKREVRSMKSKFTKFEAANQQAKLDRELAKREAATEDPTPEDLAAIEGDPEINPMLDPDSPEFDDQSTDLDD